jgi:hypothetical protein
MWLLDNNINIKNCLYYKERNIFCFGWKNSIEKSVAKELKKALAKFPYRYEIK